MTMKTIRSLSVAMLVVMVSTTANASTIQLVGGSSGSIPGTADNEFIDPGLFPGPQMGGYFGSQIWIDAAVPSSITFEFFGAEAGYRNEFNWNGSELFAHTGGSTTASSLASPLASFESTILGFALLSFSFDVNSNNLTLSNGSNPNDLGGATGAPNFFASCDPFSGAAGSGGTSCSSVYLFLDDGGAGPDDNHDDFLVRISTASLNPPGIESVQTVPEPSSLSLAALIGFGLVARRLRRR
jgi:hypothetical protein